MGTHFRLHEGLFQRYRLALICHIDLDYLSSSFVCLSVRLTIQTCCRSTKLSLMFSHKRNHCDSVVCTFTLWLLVGVSAVKALPTVSWLWWFQSEAPQAHPKRLNWWWLPVESWYSSIIKLSTKKKVKLYGLSFETWTEKRQHHCWYRWATEMFVLMTHYLGYSKTLNYLMILFSWVVVGRPNNTDCCLEHHKWWQFSVWGAKLKKSWPRKSWFWSGPENTATSGGVWGVKGAIHWEHLDFTANFSLCLGVSLSQGVEVVKGSHQIGAADKSGQLHLWHPLLILCSDHSRGSNRWTI